LEVQQPRIRYDLATFKTESEPEDFQINNEKVENKTIAKKTRGLKPKTLKKIQNSEPIERPPTFKAIPFKIPSVCIKYFKYKICNSKDK